MSQAIRLPSKVNSAAIDALLADVKSRPVADIVIDASDVEHIGGMGLQALLVVGAECDSAGFRLTVENMSQAASETFKLLGVDPARIAKGDIS